MTYDTMSVHELILEAARIGVDGFPLPAIESALRRAVIREASVGTCHIGIGFNLTLNEPNTPDGDYLLIPKKREP